MSLRRIAMTCLPALLLAACAPAPRPAVQLPPLRLSPAALGQPVSLQQQLHFQFGQQQRDLDALLEVDGEEVRLLVQAMGQSGVRLFWDGKTLRQQRAPWLPSTLRGERVLDDLQFALWPAAAIRAALPAGWQLNDDGQQRVLLQNGQPWLRLQRLESGRLQLENLAEGYRLEIDSTASSGGSTPP